MCHQTVSLTARHLEAQGIPTVVMGCARDLVETCGVARFAWSDFPLGNACGRPNDPASQRAILAIALDLFESARSPRTTVMTPYRWADNDDWKNDFWHVEMDEAKAAATRAAFEQQKATHKSRESVA